MEHKSKKPLWVKFKDLKARYRSIQTECADLEKQVNGIRGLKDKRDLFIQLAGLQNAYDDWCELGIVDDYAFYRDAYKNANDTSHKRTMQAIDYLEALVKAEKECERLKGELRKAQLTNGGVMMHDFSPKASQNSVK